MDIERFIAEIKAYKARTGKAHKAIAEDLGLELGYLHKILYKDKPLTLQVVEKAAPVLGLTVQDFLVVVAPAPGSDLDPFDQAFANSMGKLGPGLTPEMRAVLVEMAKAGQVKAAARRRAEKK